MSFFGVGNPFSTGVGQKIEQATDGALPSEDWSLNMEICDLINSTADGPRDAIKAIRKRLTANAGKNYTIVMYTLTVLETCVKNCGKQFHLQVCTKDFIGELVKMIGPKNDPPTVVQDKVLSLIQCWADAFQNQPELQGVVQVYQELRVKGVEFPIADLDAMAPIFTPQRSVPDSVDGGPVGSPQRAALAPASPAHIVEAAQPAIVTLSPSQTSKLRADVGVVQGNIAVMADMLNEMATQPAETALADLELLNELAGTLKAMQGRVAELVARLGGDDPLTGELLYVNDQLNSLLLRHSRFVKNRSAAGNATPSAILGAAMGVPGAGDTASKVDDALIDFNDDVDIAKLKISDTKGATAGKEDEFDILAQSRNVSFDSAKGSSNAEHVQQSSGATAASSRQPSSAQSTEMDPREIDEIAAWLNQEKDAQQGAGESVTSSDFDKFLAERAAVADRLPDAGAGTGSGHKL